MESSWAPTGTHCEWPAHESNAVIWELGLDLDEQKQVDMKPTGQPEQASLDE